MSGADVSGLIDEVNTFEHRLDRSQIAGLYRHGKTVPDILWRLVESDTVHHVLDQSGNANHGRGLGNAYFGLKDHADFFGHRDDTADLTGAVINSSRPGPAHEFTMLARVNSYTKVRGIMALTRAFDGRYPSDVEVSMRPDRRIVFEVTKNGVRRVLTSGTLPLPPDMESIPEHFRRRTSWDLFRADFA